MTLRHAAATPLLEGAGWESVPCPLGCPPDDEPILQSGDRLREVPGGPFTLVRCRCCDLMRTTPRPTPETMGRFYPDDYGPYVATRVSAATGNTAGGQRSWRRAARALFPLDTQRLPAGLAPGRMLEIGCASGAFLHRMAGQSWDVSGIEFSPRAAASARALGYPVHTGALETAPEPPAPYDLVVGWMVLEHLHDPVQCLRKLFRWTRPGGWLVVSVPNAGALEFRLFKSAWYALQLPTHLFHYTPETLGRLLAHCGWRRERVLHQRVLGNIVGSVGIALKSRARLAGLGKALAQRAAPAAGGFLPLYPLAAALSLVGQTGRMTVIAQRANA